MPKPSKHQHTPEAAETQHTPPRVRLASIRLDTIDPDLIDKATAILARTGTDLATYFRLQIRALVSANRILGLGDAIPFGKYVGENIEVICRAAPDYMAWLTTNSTSAKFDGHVLRLIEELSERREAMEREARELGLVPCDGSDSV